MFYLFKYCHCYSKVYKTSTYAHTNQSMHGHFHMVYDFKNISKMHMIAKLPFQKWCRTYNTICINRLALFVDLINIYMSFETVV